MGEPVKQDPKMAFVEPPLADSGTLRKLKEGVGAHVKREQKMPYEAPTLTAYGTIVELTKRVGAHGNSDHGGGGPLHNKTAF
jgi:hypothetical protein